MAASKPKVEFGPEIDVAISFLAKHEPLAKQLKTGLEDGLEVFFFPHSQEQLAGTDGLESMRTPFMDARVVVVLFDDSWGETPWTRVEKTAITDRCLNKGWDSLLFVQISKTNTPPKWLPQTHVRFNLEDYGIDQLIGVIKARVQDQGGKIKPLDAIGEARRVRREADYISDRDAMVRDQTWISNVVHRSVEDAMQEVVRLVGELRSDHGFDVIAVAEGQKCTMRAEYVSVGCGWTQPIMNLVLDDPYTGECHLRVAEFSGRLLLPGERGMYVHGPKLLKEHKFKVGVSMSRELVWIEKGKKEHIAADKLGDRIVQIFLKLIERSNAGKIERPFA